jgi:hypothetical protein
MEWTLIILSRELLHHIGIAQFDSTLRIFSSGSNSGFVIKQHKNPAGRRADSSVVLVGVHT